MGDLLTRLGASPDDLAVVVVAGLAIYVWVIVATRVAGLRSLATMSAFDFAMTVAIGSIIASTILGTAPLAAALLAVALLYGAQVVVSRLRRRRGLEQLIDNTPRLLMLDGELIETHLTAARVTHDDLRARLRGAGVLHLADVRAVVLETTGDISVLRGGDQLDPWLLEGVRH